MTSSRLRTIDCDYVAPELACAYLRIEGDEAAFVETNTTYAVPKLLDALDGEGMSPESVRWIIVTHVHLDHAGGASALAAECPNAIVLAHPRAARHLIDPQKLVGSAKQVYGEQAFGELYGTIEPIASERVRSLEDGASVSLGGSPLHFHHLRGHANHHFAVHDPGRDTVYTGDAFGLAYPRLQRGGPFAFPSTSPTDFDGPAAKEAVDRILALGTSTACLTHFGEVSGLSALAEQLHRWLDLSIELVERFAKEPDATLESAIRGELDRAMTDALRERGLTPDANDKRLLELDLNLNAQGLAFAVRRRRA